VTCKGFEEEGTFTSKQEGGKAGGKDNKNYIPPAVVDAV